MFQFLIGTVQPNMDCMVAAIDGSERVSIPYRYGTTIKNIMISKWRVL